MTIIAGCGIHNGGDMESRHDGIHRFFVGKNAKLKYVEKHYGDGDGKGERVMNPRTEITMDEGSYMEMESVQIKGVDSTKRDTVAHLAAGAKLVVQERLMTHGHQDAESRFDVCLDGENSSANIISRSVARDQSHQAFYSNLRAIVCVPAIRSVMRSLWTKQRSALSRRSRQTIRMRPSIHEAAIGKIAGDQIIKLMTLGLTEEEAEAQIVNGFLEIGEGNTADKVFRGKAWYWIR